MELGKTDMEEQRAAFIIDATVANFEEAVLQASFNTPVLVDFWAPWCNPCKMLMPVLTKLAEEFEGKFILAKVNVDENQELATQFNARSVPTVKIFRNGAVVDEFMGAQSESNVRKVLDNHIERASDKMRLQAGELIQQGDLDDAITLLQQANQEDPDNTRVRLDLISVLFLKGEYADVEQAIHSLPLAERETPEIKGLQNRLLFAKVAADADEIEALRSAIESDGNNSEARYQLAAQLLVDGDTEAALQALLLLLMRDRTYGDDAARKGMVAILESIGEHEVTSKWRRKMSSALL
jgi:putative thioredoxin